MSCSSNYLCSLGVCVTIIIIKLFAKLTCHTDISCDVWANLKKTPNCGRLWASWLASKEQIFEKNKACLCDKAWFLSIHHFPKLFHGVPLTFIPLQTRDSWNLAQPLEYAPKDHLLLARLPLLNCIMWKKMIPCELHK